MIKFEYNFLVGKEQTPHKQTFYIDPSEVSAVYDDSMDNMVRIFLRRNDACITVDGPLDVVMEKLGRNDD